MIVCPFCETLIAEQIEYIETVQSLVAEALKSDREVSIEEQSQIITQLEQQYADYKTTLLLPDLQVGNIQGVAQELQQG